MTSVCPVTYPAALWLARNATAAATSHALPIRPMGTLCCVIFSNVSLSAGSSLCSRRSTIGVYKSPGSTQLSLIPFGAYKQDVTFVRCITAALAVL